MGGALAVAAWPKFSCTQIGEEPFFKTAALSSQAERHITSSGGIMSSILWWTDRKPDPRASRGGTDDASRGASK